MMTKDEARAAASEILAKDPTNWAMRSCWNCNGTHKHLKRAEYIIRCFECGHTFYRGIDITEEGAPEAEPEAVTPVSPDFAAVVINHASVCLCGHHPLRHDCANRLMTGGPAKCQEPDCECVDLRMAPGNPAPIELVKTAVGPTPCIESENEQ